MCARFLEFELTLAEEKKTMNFAKSLARSLKETALAETVTVGRHTVTTQRKLAEGGFAVVYLARDERGDAWCAAQLPNGQKKPTTN